MPDAPIVSLPRRRPCPGDRALPPARWAIHALAVLLLVAAGCRESVPAPRVVEPSEDVAGLAKELSGFIEEEIRAKGIPAFSIALVMGDETVWAAGFGEEDPDEDVAADAGTVYRVGSVSKLFTDIALMRLVERGEVDLDAPVRELVPEFRPENPHGTPVTLRQLMCHRSGLVREPPVGSYFDSGEPSLEATVASLGSTRLVYPPLERQKYSNAGVTIVGRALEQASGQPFAEAVEELVLRPCGLRASSFARSSQVERRLARARMRGYDGREFDAPVFQLGTAPAGNLYAPMTDLAAFLRVLFREGRLPGRDRLLEGETLREMMTVQLAGTDAERGFGLGFYVSRLDGRLRIGHGGAVYGYSTQLTALPQERVGVAAAASLDVSNAFVRRVADYALRALLALRTDTPPPAPLERSREVPTELAERLEGRWEADGGDRVRLETRGGRLILEHADRHQEVRLLDGGLVVDDRHAFGTRLALREDDRVLEVGATPYRRLPPQERPDPPPARWRGLIGEYGPDDGETPPGDHNVMWILEKDGRLHALVEWIFEYPLTETAENTYRFPNRGLYHGEEIVFERDPSGRARRAVVAGVPFLRRQLADDDETFRVEPVGPRDEILEQALAAEPPAEGGDYRPADLVELQELESSIRYDIRYATTNNFLGMVFYDEARAFLQRPAAEALAGVHRDLADRGFGLLIYDAYRPWYVTKMFWDATPPHLHDFVADPSHGSRHNRGCAVDLTLLDLATGEPVDTGAGYDEFSTRSYPHWPGGTSRQRWHRRLLRETLGDAGFTVYEYEWWHFDYRDWREYRIGNARFEELAGPGSDAGPGSEASGAETAPSSADTPSGG